MSSSIDTSSTEFQNALSLIRFTRQSVFLTGKAGTGKSTFLRYVCQEVKKKHVVLAPTGIAAINAGGSTLHSFFKLPFYPLVPDDPRFSTRRIKDFLKYNKTHIKLLQEVELIIIDEISMVRADIIDFIDKVLRVYCRNMREPFGGKQMLLVGDLYQLEPVVTADEREILNRFYPNPFFFSAHVFKEMQLVSIELQKVYRQKDAGFIAALDHIRNNTISDIELKLLNTRVATPEGNPKDSRTIPEGSDTSLAITLATRRDTVDFINQTELDRLPGDPLKVKGQITGDFPENSLPTLMELELKPGAHVIFIKNDPDHRWVNGTLGIISELDVGAESMRIVKDDGTEVEVTPERWANVRYTYNEKEKKIDEEEIGTFTQFPIRLAWAITIHKSQGLTFDNAIIDFTGGTFAGGQAYVALSRCRSLHGMTLRNPITRSDIFVRPEITEFAQTYNDTNLLQRALHIARADTEYQACVEAFNKGDMEECLEHFFTAIHSRYDIEKPLQRRFIQWKLNQINRLRRQRDYMDRMMKEQEMRLQKFAREYYALGNASITESHNRRAAIANYSKALELYPDYVDALVRRGVTLMEEKKTDEALADFNRAVKVSPTCFKAFYNRAKALMDKGALEEAQNNLFKAISLRDDHPGAHKLLGDVFSRLGDEEKAAIYWQIAEELHSKRKK